MLFFRLCWCTGWYVSLLFRCNKIRFSNDVAHIDIYKRGAQWLSGRVLDEIEGSFIGPDKDSLRILKLHLSPYLSI